MCVASYSCTHMYVYVCVKVLLGIDRLDYIKGIPHKLYAFERFFEQNPDWIGKVSDMHQAMVATVGCSCSLRADCACATRMMHIFTPILVF